MNRYEQPAQANFINTYVPMPFEQLMAVGDKYRQELEKSQEKLAGFRKEHSQFQSLSDKDRQQYYDLTFGAIAPAVERLSKDPEYLKTAEGRAEISGLIGSVDYGQISQLRKSAEMLDQYSKTKAELKAKGLYSADWDDVNIADYDTATQGVFSEVSPMQYKSIKSLTDTYFDQLDKGKFLRKEGMWDISGVDRADLENVANDQVINEIYMLPETQKHIQVARNKGLIPDNMTEKEWLRQATIQSQTERLSERRELNPLAVMEYKENLEMKKIAAKAKGEEEAGKVPAMYDILYQNTLDTENKLIQNNPEAFKGLSGLLGAAQQATQDTAAQIDNLTNQLNAGEIDKASYDKAVTGLTKQYETAMQAVSPDAIQEQYQSGIKDMYNSYLGIPNFNELSPKERKAIKADARGVQAANQTISAISTKAPGFVMGEYNSKMSSSAVSINQGGNVVTGYNRANTSGLQLTVDVYNKLTGSKQKETYKVKSSYDNTEKDFGADIRSGRIKNVLLVPNDQVFNIRDKGVNKLAQTVMVKIPVQSLVDAGYDADSIHDFMSSRFGARKETNISSKTISRTSVEGAYGETDERSWYEKLPMVSRDVKLVSSVPYAGEYYTIEMVEEIDPSTAGAIMFESGIDKAVGGTKQSGGTYTQRVGDAFSNL